MIRYFYDTEFLETGHSINLISIGIVTEDGSREYYAVNREINDGQLYGKIRRHKWLIDNVVPHLPVRMKTVPVVLRDGSASELPGFDLDLDHPDVKPRGQIADEVRDFLLRPNGPMELWAYYGAYDHVVMSWLWGPMMNRPNGIPMFSHDVMQLASLLGMDDANLPRQIGQLHNALDDARWTRDAWRHLTSYARRNS